MRLRRSSLNLLAIFQYYCAIFFARFVFEFLDRWFRPISVRYLGFPLFGAGAVLALIGLYLLGVLATNVLGSRLLGAFETFIGRLPLLSPIYQGARQITEAVQIRETRQFQKVVLLGFPHPAVKSIGFVTREFPDATTFGDESTVLVFVPTTPNPTSGYLVAVPSDAVTPLEISVEEGVKLVISGGLLTPKALLGVSSRDEGEVTSALPAGEDESET